DHEGGLTLLRFFDRQGLQRLDLDRADATAGALSRCALIFKRADVPIDTRCSVRFGMVWWALFTMSVTDFGNIAHVLLIHVPASFARRPNRVARTRTRVTVALFGHITGAGCIAARCLLPQKLAMRVAT